VTTPTIDTIEVADPPEAWRAAGFDVEPDGLCRVGRVRIRLVGRERGRGIVSWSLRDATVEHPEPDGLPTSLSAAEPCEPGRHPNEVLQIDHVVLVTPDTARTTAVLEAMGFEPRRTRHTDQYGAPSLQVFFRAGEVIIEVIGPEEPGGDGPAAFFGLAYTVADLDATAGVLGDALGTIKQAVQPGRRIATLRHRLLGLSVPTAFLSPEVDEPHR
jgi:catechol 2,3-dioxygenase-like lactoylglutathione lyase family enzyme